MTTRLTTLSNGFRIVTEHMPGLQSASAGVWVMAGGRHETAAQNGIAHFLEHMAFKGTKRRSALRIAESYGAHARLWLKEERGQHFGAGLYESEVRYLIAREWAHSLEDILWRRSKLGLHVPEGTEARLAEYLAGEPRRMARSASPRRRNRCPSANWVSMVSLSTSAIWRKTSIALSCCSFSR